MPIDPLPWNPPIRPPMEGVYEPNEGLLDAELIGAGLLNIIKEGKTIYKSVEIFLKVVFVCLIQVGACLVPIDPLPWNPPIKPPMEGVYEPNEGLLNAELIGAGLLYGPEDVAIDEEGRLYAGSGDGVIQRVLPDGQVEVFATTGGGIHWAWILMRKETSSCANQSKGSCSP